MAGLDPAIHVSPARFQKWMAGSETGHDEWSDDIGREVPAARFSSRRSSLEWSTGPICPALPVAPLTSGR
jgi:hypothetical protein